MGGSSAATPVPASSVKRAVLALRDGDRSMQAARFAPSVLRLAEMCLGELVALVTAEAQEKVDKQGGRSIGAEHIFAAARALEFDVFLRPLQDALEAFRVVEAAEREAKRARKRMRNTLPEGTTEQDVEDMQNELFSSARQRMGFNKSTLK